MSESNVIKVELDHISKVFPKSSELFSIQSYTSDELCCLFKDGKNVKHFINCTISGSYPTSKLMWYSSTDDQQVTDVLEKLTQTEFSKECQLVDMVIFLVVNLCKMFNLSIVTQVKELEDLKNKGVFHEAANKAKLKQNYDEEYEEDDDEDDDEDLHDVSDDILEEIVQAETDKARKEQNEISEENQMVLAKIIHIQRQKHLNGVVKAGSVQASDRLMKELKAIYKSESLKNGSYSIDLVNDSLYEWQVNILKVDNESPLHGDLNKLKVLKGNDASIMIGMSFRDNYPFEPPFVRVISPVLQGGFVLGGGAICMELLTRQGWSGAYSIESLIIQIVATLVKGKARIRFDVSQNSYTLTKAKQSFKRLVDIHEKNGWYTPPKQDG